MPIALCWFASIASYLFYLTRQKSVLNTWPKPNALSDLLDSYNDSLLILTFIIPLFVAIIENKSGRSTKTRSIKEIEYSKPIIITSILWLSVPFIFWTLSHLSPLNLFVDRYFIPKESALIFLFALGLSFILQKLPQQKFKSIFVSSATGLSIVLSLISTKRTAFGLNKDTNYHHSLIIEESYPISKQPIILEGDPNFFPNTYLGKNKYYLDLKHSKLKKIYSNFSKKINIK